MADILALDQIDHILGDVLGMIADPFQAAQHKDDIDGVADRGGGLPSYR